MRADGGGKQRLKNATKKKKKKKTHLGLKRSEKKKRSRIKRYSLYFNGVIVIPFQQDVVDLWFV